MLHRPPEQTHLMTAHAPLVLLPGTLCDAEVYRPVLERLGVPGLTLALRDARSAAQMAERVLEQCPGKMSLLGFSLGAVIALHVAAMAPQRIERLALIGCNPGVLDDDTRARRARIGRDDFIRQQVPPAARAMALRASDAEFEAQTAMTLNRTDSVPRLGQIAVPTLVLCGAEDQICPPQLSRLIADRIPHARLAVIAQADHYVTLSQPDAVAREVLAWLATPSPTPEEPS